MSDSSFYREEFVRSLAQLPDNEQDAIQKVIDERWPVCVGAWDAQGAKQSYTCLMGAAALAATEHVWSQIPELCNDLGSLEYLASENLSYEAMEVPEPFDQFFGGVPEHREAFTRLAAGSQSTRILNAAGRAALQSALTDAKALGRIDYSY